METKELKSLPLTEEYSESDSILLITDTGAKRIPASTFKQGSGGNADQSGMSEELKTALVNYYTHVMPNFDDTNGLSYINAILTALGAETRVEPVEPEEPDTPEVTLSSISATYSGGDVAVGTAVTALTGIVVTAHYSDGSTETVTGYTLSGTIAEGSNTITVSYGGKTTTFTVTGIAEESGGGEATSAELTLTKTSNGAGTFSNFYSDGGETTTTGKQGTVWISDKIAAEDDEVTITVLYGIANSNLKQYAANVESTYGPNAYYYEEIGYAQATEYSVKYTVRAGQRLAIFNYNSGAAQSITVTTENPDAWPDIVNTNLYDGRYEVGRLGADGTIDTAVTSARTTDYIDCTGMSELYTLIDTDGYKNSSYRLNAVWFNADKTALLESGSVSPPSATKEPVAVPSGAAFVRICYADTYASGGAKVYIGTKSLPHETEYVAISTLIE